jgi:PAS domain S-box-containing protein
VILGAIELASFQTFQSCELEYLKRIGESVGYNLHAIGTHRQTETLLNESRVMAQEVKAQEEELRQNMEELTATQEQMRQKQTEMDAVLSSLSMIEIDVKGCITFANQVFLSITGYSDVDILSKGYRDLVPEEENERRQFDLMWSSISTGQTFSGEFRILGKEKKDMWMVGNFSPIRDEHMRLYKVIVTSLFVTKEKQKLLEMQDTITAIKDCFPIAEINSDLTFKSANDLLLMELGIKRMELRKLLLEEVIPNGSFGAIKEYFTGTEEIPKRLEISLRSKTGTTKKFSSTLIKINVTSAQKKGLLILEKSH